MGRSDREAVSVELVQDLSEVSRPMQGYLKRHRVRARTVLGDGTRTEPYVVDWVDRGPERRDAVCVVLYAREGDAVQVLLRRQVRVPVHLMIGRPALLELVAGVIDHPDSPMEAAIKEVEEEAGIRVQPSQMRELGRPFFPVPASFTERIFVWAAQVPASAFDLSGLALPPTDGSPLEQGADRWVLTLDAALALSDVEPGQGPHGLFLADAKTELGLRRLEAELRRG